jgi:DNA-binding YbaB/EbfC family protein
MSMFGKMGDMMGKLQEMKKKADEIKSKLDETVIRSESSSGEIQIEISGNRQLKKIKIAAALQHGDSQLLEQHLVAAINKAIAEADQLNEQEMKKAATGMLPGL